MIVAMTPPPACYATVKSFYAARYRKDTQIIVVTDGTYAYTSWY